MPLTWRDAVVRVLEESGSPMYYRDIADSIVENGFREGIGANPSATVSATIWGEINREGERSAFVKVDRGVFMLRGQAVAPSVQEDEEQYEVITSFGMYWRRDAVVWRVPTRLFGVQQRGAAPVDFAEQVGIYLLYDAREVLYVGRATGQPIAKRLLDHTVDRLSSRWDRFSWFGVRPVADSGELEQIPESLSTEKIVPALEAVLIESLEPRQNRKRGDDLAAVEYQQQVDPDVERRRAIQALL